MASLTTIVTLNNTSWTQVSTNKSSVQLSSRMFQPVYAAVANDASDLTSLTVGHKVDYLNKAVFENIATGQSVFVMAPNGSAEVIVTTSDPVAIKTTNDTSTSATGGLSGFKVISSSGTNATVVKNSPARLYGAQFHNAASTWAFAKFYNMATTPTVGTSTVIAILGIPPGGRATVNNVQGIYCSNGIAFALTGAAPDNDTTAVAANDLAGGITYA